MGAAEAIRHVSLEDYFVLAEQSVDKLEYYAGEVFAMAGGTYHHDVIITNLLAELRFKLKGKSCRPNGGNLRIRTTSGLYTYPDATVTCGKPEFDPRDRKEMTLVNPTALFEVTSDSSDAYDRGAKFGFYKHIPTLMAYVIIAQDRAQVEVWRRHELGGWDPEVFTGLEATARIACIEMELPLSELYADVELDSPLQILPPQVIRDDHPTP